MRIFIVSALLGLLAMTTVAQPAFAYGRDYDHDGWRGRRDWHHEHVWVAPRPPVVVRYYAGPPVYYYPPVYYPAPVYPAPAYSVLQFRIF